MTSGKKLSPSGSVYIDNTGGRYEPYSVNLDVVSLFETHNESLMRIFQYYCSYGEPMNNTKLKSIKFMRILKESGLIGVRLLFYSEKNNILSKDTESNNLLRHQKRLKMTSYRIN